MLSEGDSRALDALMYLPPGKDVSSADRSLGIDAERKGSYGDTLDEFTKKNIAHYRSAFEGSVVRVDDFAVGARLVRLYFFRPKPGLSWGMYQSSAFLQEGDCFVHVFLAPKTESAQSEYISAFKSAVAAFRLRKR